MLMASKVCREFTDALSQSRYREACVTPESKSFPKFAIMIYAIRFYFFHRCYCSRFIAQVIFPATVKYTSQQRALLCSRMTEVHAAHTPQQSPRCCCFHFASPLSIRITHKPSLSHHSLLPIRRSLHPAASFTAALTNTTFLRPPQSIYCPSYSETASAMR